MTSPGRHDDTAARDPLTNRLRHIFWIGGGSGSGKTTIARRLAAEHGMRHYSTDDVMPDHASRSRPEDAPFLARFVAMNMDERWVTRSPEVMLETFHWFRGEGFGMIVEDLLRLPRNPAVVVEGFRLLPHLVQPLLAAPHQAVWLLPTPDYRRAVFDSRGSSSWAFLAHTSDPERALHNLLARDGMFTDRLRKDVAGLQLPTVEVDVAMTDDELLARVTETFGL